MKVGGDEQSVIFVIDGNCPHNIGMATMQHADKLADGFPVLQVHAVFAGYREWFNDAGTSIFQLTLQVVIAMHNKKDTEQQTYQDGRGQDQNHHACAQAVVGHGVPLWDN